MGLSRGAHLARIRSVFRFQFNIPIEIVEPGLVEIIGRETTTLLLQLKGGRSLWALDRMHVYLMRHPTAFAKVTWATGGDNILPACAPAFRSRNKVIERQIFRRSAIDALEPIPQENIETRKCWLTILPDELAQRDNGRQAHRKRGRMDIFVILSNHIDAFKKHRLDHLLPGPE